MFYKVSNIFAFYNYSDMYTCILSMHCEPLYTYALHYNNIIDLWYTSRNACLYQDIWLLLYHRGQLPGKEQELSSYFKQWATSITRLCIYSESDFTVVMSIYRKVPDSKWRLEFNSMRQSHAYLIAAILHWGTVCVQETHDKSHPAITYSQLPTSHYCSHEQHSNLCAFPS